MLTIRSVGAEPVMSSVTSILMARQIEIRKADSGLALGVQQRLQLADSELPKVEQANTGSGSSHWHGAGTRIPTGDALLV